MLPSLINNRTKSQLAKLICPNFIYSHKEWTFALHKLEENTVFVFKPSSVSKAKVYTCESLLQHNATTFTSHTWGGCFGVARRQAAISCDAALEEDLHPQCLFWPFKCADVPAWLLTLTITPISQP